MTVAEEIHVDDIGTAFEVTLYDEGVVLDASGATTKQIVFRKPTVDGVLGEVVTKTAQFKTDGSDGIILYASVADDLDVAGTWKIQAKVTLPSGVWSSSIGSFRVYENL